MFNFFAETIARRIPTGFPITSPAKIPQAITEVDAFFSASDVRITPVFANAKIGTTT